MAKSTGSIDKWRHYFSSANSDIFDVIEQAIVIAAMDYPKDFKYKRDRIAELLFSCRVAKCFNCDEVVLAVPDGVENEDNFEACRNTETKVNSRGDDHGYSEDAEVDLNHYTSNYSNREAEALTDEIEEETQTFREVLRIKEILVNYKDESDSLLFNSLRRLQLMGLSVEILKASEIGKSVKALEKHGSDQIKKLAKTLVKDWMAMVEEWLKATEAVANVTESTPESIKISGVVDEEEGLPSPPLDEGAFFITETGPMEWGEFFDGMDDDGNPRNSGEFKKNRENGRKPAVKISNVDKSKQQVPQNSMKPSTTQEISDKKQGVVIKPNKPSLGESGTSRLTKPDVEQNTNFEFKSQKKPDRVTMKKRELTSQQNKLRDSDKEAVVDKLEASKRKLQERYQEAENAKKQRKVQVMELHDIPKKDVVQRNPHTRPGGNHGRFSANGCH